MRNFVKVIILAVGVTALAAGCGKKEATCESAIDNAIKVSMDSDEMKKASPEDKKMAESMMAGLKGEMIKKCKEKKQDAKDLQCAVDAKDAAALKKCGDFMN
jgi:small lipoprotein (TIGR04454 family)